MNSYIAQAVSPSIEGSFLGYGIVGAVALLSLSVAIFLYRELKAERARGDTLQEKRISEAERHASEIVPLLGPLTEQTKYIYEQAIRSEKRGN